MSRDKDRVQVYSNDYRKTSLDRKPSQARPRHSPRDPIAPSIRCSLLPHAWPAEQPKSRPSTSLNPTFCAAMAQHFSLPCRRFHAVSKPSRALRRRPQASPPRSDLQRLRASNSSDQLCTATRSRGVLIFFSRATILKPRLTAKQIFGEKASSDPRPPTGLRPSRVSTKLRKPPRVDDRNQTQATATRAFPTRSSSRSRLLSSSRRFIFDEQPLFRALGKKRSWLTILPRARTACFPRPVTEQQPGTCRPSPGDVCQANQLPSQPNSHQSRSLEKPCQRFHAVSKPSRALHRRPQASPPRSDLRRIRASNSSDQLYTATRSRGVLISFSRATILKPRLTAKQISGEKASSDPRPPTGLRPSRPPRVDDRNQTQATATRAFPTRSSSRSRLLSSSRRFISDEQPLFRALGKKRSWLTILPRARTTCFPRPVTEQQPGTCRPSPGDVCQANQVPSQPNSHQSRSLEK
ncbi:leucine-rich repeat serine/threonine-protein kinase 1, partial [Striga asiatica]